MPFIFSLICSKTIETKNKHEQKLLPFFTWKNWISRKKLNSLMKEKVYKTCYNFKSASQRSTCAFFSILVINYHTFAVQLQLSCVEKVTNFQLHRLICETNQAFDFVSNYGRVIFMAFRNTNKTSSTSIKSLIIEFEWKTCKLILNCQLIRNELYITLPFVFVQFRRTMAIDLSQHTWKCV